MPIRYPVKLPGLEDRNIELEPAGIIKPARLLVDGHPAEKGERRNEMVIRRTNGKKVSVYFEPSIFDNLPKLKTGGKTYQVAPPIAWYQYVWCALPLILVFTGGVVGAVLGLIAFLFNIRLMRARIHPGLRYLVTLGISAAAYLVYFLAAMLITVTTGGL